MQERYQLQQLSRTTRPLRCQNRVIGALNAWATFGNFLAPFSNLLKKMAGGMSENITGPGILMEAIT